MKIFKALFSGAFMGILLLVFAFAIGYATFIENDFGAETARLIIYNTWWFELILLLMVINFSGMIFTKKLYKKSKLNILLIHVALVIIIIGAGITRYFSYEGQMHLRNGETSDEFLSATTYVQINHEGGMESDEVLLSSAKSNIYSNSFTINNTPVDISLIQYMPNAEPYLRDSKGGDAYISLVVGNMMGRNPFFLKEGETKLLYDIGFSFGDTTQTELVQFIEKNGEVYYRLPEPMIIQDSAARQRFEPLKAMEVMELDGVNFVVKEFIPSAIMQYKNTPEELFRGTPMAAFNINGKEVYVPFRAETIVNTNGTSFNLKLDYKTLKLPFYIKLNKFDLERYPGSNSPSSFSSDITVVDSLNREEFPYSIYMNHILNYGGYRFFQSSYDQDEMGTVLTVNHDKWGTNVSYLGYFLLFLSLIISFFTPKTRFSRITKQLKDIHKKRKKLVVSAAIFIGLFLGFNPTLKAEVDKNFRDHARSFSTLFVQNKEGRVEPVNTLANKVLVKVSKKASYNDMDANEFLLDLIVDREKWKNEPVIKVPEKSIQQILGIASDYASFNDFVTETGQYKLKEAIEEANNKKPALRSQHDKGIINVDERLNVMYMSLSGSMLKILPVPNDANNKWVTPQEHHKAKGHGNVEGDLFETYVNDLREAKSTGNYELANADLEKIRAYQNEYGASVLPSQTKLKLEIFYNETNIFKSLFPFYLLLGSILVGLFFIQTFRPKLDFKRLTNVFRLILVFAFAIQTVGLAIRWYITGHAPWSNGYESMIYISWATMLAGFVFMKRSSITLGVTALLSGITLLTAHMSWLNPELTNLVPVLKSYWLTIHVATITASYGFLGLGCMVAFLNLCMMIFRNEENYKRINLTLKELNLIVEMSLTVGLVLLVIGNFLGGIWANESWGRYWGWDPKETWTLVTIILYTFTLHLTLIPSIRNTFTFSFMAFISFGGVLMTYFGVNYYLSGLHSYAAGDPLAIPKFVYYALVVIAVVSVISGMNEFKFRRLNKAVKKPAIKED